MFVKVWENIHVDHTSVVMISIVERTDFANEPHVKLEFDTPHKSLELPPEADYDEVMAALNGLCSYSTAWSGEDNSVCLQHNTPVSQDFEDRGPHAPCESAVYRKLPSINLPKERTTDEEDREAPVRGLYL